MGKMIVIEGLDGSGKGTQSKILYEALKSMGKEVYKISFPNYESESSSLVKMYLSGNIGKKAEDVNAYAASSFYACDRYISYLKEWKSLYTKEDSIIIADRYTTANLLHQLEKLPKKEWESFHNWLFQYEFEQLGLPKPDMVIYLDVNPSVSQGLLTNRYNQDDSKKDIHERDLDYMNRCYYVAQYLKEKTSWEFISCQNDKQEMRSIQDISEEVYSKTKRIL